MTTTNHSTSEVGHAKNVANFEELIVNCQSFDTEYNPVNDLIIDHFSALIELLAQIPQYTPNETQLQIASLNAKLEQMKAINTQHINDYTELSKMLIKRNRILYNPLIGLVAVAKLVKQYVKSVFGAKSPEYQLISDIEFRKVK